MERLIDLHAHTTSSDGTLTPSELAREAKKAGLYACAITDHDTVSGVDEFLRECRKIGIEGVPGVELSARFEGELHIVGLYIDYENEEFIRKANVLKNSREIRNIEMIKRCQDLGMDITKEDILNIGGARAPKSVGRPHFAAVMIKKGYVKSTNEAFEKYIGKGKPCYCDRKLYSPKECIKMIKDAGGAAILAHPCLIKKDRTSLVEIIKELKSYGLDGMECRYCMNTPEFTEFSIRLCEELDLLKSGGSDFHGDNKPKLRLGCGYGDLAVPYEYLENIKRNTVKHENS